MAVQQHPCQFTRAVVKIVVSRARHPAPIFGRGFPITGSARLAPHHARRSGQRGQALPCERIRQDLPWLLSQLSSKRSGSRSHATADGDGCGL